MCTVFCPLSTTDAPVLYSELPTAFPVSDADAATPATLDLMPVSSNLWLSPYPTVEANSLPEEYTWVPVLLRKPNVDCNNPPSSLSTD